MNIYINNYINPEDEIILIHSTLIQFLINNEYEKVKENFNNFFNNLIEQSKTILIPSFTYKTWDYNMKNVNTGIMSNIVIDNPNFKRTIHPIYSWFVAGKLQSEILNLKEKSILGEGSVFEFIENYKTKIILLNTSHLTYVHRIEELCYVPYRYYKDVIKDISINNEIISKKIKIFVRDPKIDAKPYFNNEKQNALRKIKSIKLIEEGDMFLFYGDLKEIKEELTNKLMNDKLFVVENKENIICKIINNYDNNININEDISKKFGYISNDINPIHVDNNFASKISEGIIIHGINIVFCILNKILKYLNNVSIQKINVVFEKLINVNKLYFISINYENDEYIIEIKDNDDLLYFKMNVLFYENNNENDYTIFESEIDRNIEKNDYDSIKLGKRDKINLFLNNEIFSIYENLRKLNKIDISILMGLTYIVCMKIPGYNSIFNEFYLENNINNIQQELVYEVIEKFDDLQKIKMSVNSKGKTGYIISQFRSPIIEEQYSIKVISKYIKKNQFINIKENKENKENDTNEIRIALLSTKNIDFINKELEKIIKIYNINKKIIIYDLDYDQMYQQIIDTNSKLYKFKPNFVFFLERIEDICKTDLLYQYKDEYESLFLEYINIIKLLNSNLKCNIFVNNFVLLQPSVFMNYDINYNMGISKMIKKWNKKLLNEKNINIIDLNQVKSINNNKIIDMREYLIGRYIFSLEFSLSLSIYYYSIILSYLEKNIRVIVLDLDNTLWGGVVGDDGNFGIEYGNDFPGNCFKLFQNYLKLLKNRGILLTISSKNNYDTVENVFKERKDFELKLDDFICIKANWEPKYKNVLEISKEIGIGIDNFLFIDDNIVEREQMKLNIPNINILDLPNQPELYYESLIKSPFFNCIKIKEEDFKRNDAYIAKMNIDSSKDKYNNLEDFYKSIEYEVHINNLNNENFDRCVQLINKTNQFNLTTLRLNHEELKELASNKLYQTFIIGYKDKYTSYENMGVLILKKNENIIEIVNYLMSCRIIGRGVEKYIFNWISNKYHNFKKIIGNFQVTDKNKEFEKIYFENDFIKENNYYYKKIANKEYDSWAKLIDNTNDSEINIITKNKNEIVKNENIILIQDNIQKILNVLDELGYSEINQKINFVSLNNWDSLKHVYFIGKLKNKFGININKKMYNLELTIEDLSLLF